MESYLDNYKCVGPKKHGQILLVKYTKYIHLKGTKIEADD